MFYNLGKLLAEYYFPDEAEAIRDQLRLIPAIADARNHPDLQADRAAGMVLGLGFEALGVGVARHWGLPDALQRCMRRPDAASPAQPMAHGPERLRWMSVAANELSDAVWQGDEQTLPRRLEAVAQRHGPALGFGLPDLRRAGDAARGALAERAPAMGLSLPKVSRAQQVLAQAPEPARPLFLRWDTEDPHPPSIAPEPFASLVKPDDVPPWPSFPDPLVGKPAIQRQQLRSWGLDGWSWAQWAPVVARYLGVVALLSLIHI